MPLYSLRDAGALGDPDGWPPGGVFEWIVVEGRRSNRIDAHHHHCSDSDHADDRHPHHGGDDVHVPASPDCAGSDDMHGDAGVRADVLR